MYSLGFKPNMPHQNPRKVVIELSMLQILTNENHAPHRCLVF